jgi:hydroxymethylpyrimidine/phosphomethylpyrimidine kinase
MPTEADIPRVLSIAGSDSGGGAGIQADIKAFARAGVHGMTAITAITAQNTVEVAGVHAIPPETIVAQVRAVVEDIGVDAVKIGMLGDSQTIAAVGRALDLVGDVPIVLDPVMVSESGAILLDPDARRGLVETLVPRATVVTPNLAEARELAAVAAASGEAARGDVAPVDVAPVEDANVAGAQVAASGSEPPADALARAVYALGPGAVVVTGGHGEEAEDVFFDGARLVRISGERHPDGAAHGSGCTHSSTLAARLALGDDPLDAARAAKAVASAAVAGGLRGIGAGVGPVDVFGLAGAGLRGTV